MRIGLLAPPVVSLPPPTYAGTERIVTSLALGLHARGHHVTVFTTGDSDLPCEVVPVVPRALWREGLNGDLGVYFQMAVARAWDEADRFDIIHSHVETQGFQFAAHGPVPVVTTLHGRLDVAGQPGAARRDPVHPAHRDQREPAALVTPTPTGSRPSTTACASRRCRSARSPGDYLAFVGRITPEKGVDDAIELARRTRHVARIAAKVYDEHEKEHFAEVVAARRSMSGVVEFLGEVDSASARPADCGRLATVMLGAWPEPFGLVAIESMATGTPVIARRAGGLTETIEHGVTGFLVDDMIEAELAVTRVAATRPWRDRQQDARALLGRPDGRCV